MRTKINSELIVGKTVKTNSGWSGVIEYYNSCFDVGVRWQDGSLSSHPMGHIKNGGIKPLFQPSLVGLGYFGEGRFVNTRIKNGEKAPDVIHDYWKRMLIRCYDEKTVVKSKGISYLNIEVCKEWLNFQNFAEWAISQPNWNMKHHLDKDLLGNGFLYSPENCTFLPSLVNSFLSDGYAKIVHDLPIGVKYVKPRTSNSKIGYMAQICTNEGRKYLGYYDTPEEAFVAYKKAKEDYAKILAERYKNEITAAAYEKLKAFVLQS